VARSLFVMTALASIVVGCVSVGPTQSTPPSAPPSFGITTPAPPTGTPAATPSAAITAAPTLTVPSVAPTEAPTIPPPTDGPSLTPAPSPNAIENFGAGTLLFFDDLSDPASGFGVGTNSGGSVGYDEGVLRFETSGDQAWLWSRRLLEDFSTVVRVEGVFVPSAAGFFGLLCARSDDELLGAVVNTDGGWFFLQLGSEGATILTSDPDAGWSVPAGLATSVALDCAGTELGPMRMQVSLPEQGVAAIFDGGEGPVDFDRVGVYAESSTHPWSLAVDNLVAYGGTGELGMSPAALTLLQHVPEAWRADCFESEPSAFETGGVASVSCPLSDVGGKSNAADYVQFDTKVNMDAAYQARVDNWAVDPTASCQTGPNEVSYTIAGTPAGRILCAPQTAGIRFDWTLDSLMILSTLTDFDGNYGDAYEDWLIAGPE